MLNEGRHRRTRRRCRRVPVNRGDSARKVVHAIRRRARILRYAPVDVRIKQCRRELRSVTCAGACAERTRSFSISTRRASSNVLIASLMPSEPSASVPYGSLPVPVVIFSSDTRSASSLRVSRDLRAHAPEDREDARHASDRKNLVLDDHAALRLSVREALFRRCGNGLHRRIDIRRRLGLILDQE